MAEHKIDDFISHWFIHTIGVVVHRYRCRGEIQPDTVTEQDYDLLSLRLEIVDLLKALANNPGSDHEHRPPPEDEQVHRGAQLRAKMVFRQLLDLELAPVRKAERQVDAGNFEAFPVFLRNIVTQSTTHPIDHGHRQQRENKVNTQSRPGRPMSRMQ